MKYYLTISFLLFFFYSFCQYEITGILKDNQDLSPVPFVIISLYDTNGRNISATETNNDGIFILKKINKGKYFLTINSAFFEDIKIKNIEIENSVTLCSIYLYEGSYHWDGYSEKPREKKGSKRKKSVSGYNSGLIMNNSNSNEFILKSPEDTTVVFKYTVNDNTLEIEYSNLCVSK